MKNKSTKFEIISEYVKHKDVKPPDMIFNFKLVDEFELSDLRECVNIFIREYIKVLTKKEISILYGSTDTDKNCAYYFIAGYMYKIKWREL